MAQIAALLHRAADMAHEPATKEIKYLLPKPALSLREPRPQQWSNMVQQAWNNVQHSSAAVCKAQVLGKSSHFRDKNNSVLYITLFCISHKLYLTRARIMVKKKFLPGKQSRAIKV